MEFRERVIKIAEFIVERRETVRGASKVFGISKSTVHADMCSRLKTIDPCLYEEVRRVLEYNLSVRHLRGGESTKRKFEQKKQGL